MQEDDAKRKGKLSFAKQVLQFNLRIIMFIYERKKLDQIGATKQPLRVFTIMTL